MSSKRVAGFTLIEIMIVVAIIALLAAIALPAYSRYGFRSRRVDGQDVLMRYAAAEERYFTTHNVYTATWGPGSGAGLEFADNLSTIHGQGPPPIAYYSVGITVGGGGATYTLTATPLNGQVNDRCGSLSIDSTSKKLFSGDELNGHCW